MSTQAAQPRANAADRVWWKPTTTALLVVLIVIASLGLAFSAMAWRAASRALCYSRAAVMAAGDGSVEFAAREEAGGDVTDGRGPGRVVVTGDGEGSGEGEFVSISIVCE